MSSFMDPQKIQTDILNFVRRVYPDMKVNVEPWCEDPSRIAIYFTESKFTPIYPIQRYHYLCHLIPVEYRERELANSVWFELAPGETVSDLQFPDEELISTITPDVMKCLKGAHVFEALDDLLCPASENSHRQRCYGDFRHTKPILLSRGFAESELFEVFHVLIASGGNCDCEILYNAAGESRLAAQYWIARSEGREPYDPHHEA